MLLRTSTQQLLIGRGVSRLSTAAARKKTAAPAAAVALPKDPAYYEKDLETGMSPFVKDQRLKKHLSGVRAPPKLFAVRKGREIGVFAGWEKTKGKVLGFSGALYKPFKSAARAKEWLECDESLLDAKDKPMPKTAPADKARASRYILNFDSSLSRSELEAKKGLVGFGWILRKLPENQMVVAGCDLFNTTKWREAHPTAPGFTPLISRELPMLEALNQALDEISKTFKLESERKLPFPLYIASDHVYTIGLLSGANPTIPDVVQPLQDAKAKIEKMATISKCEQVSLRENGLANVLARMAIARLHPRCIIDGGKDPIDDKTLRTLLSDAPDMPADVDAADPPVLNDAPVIRSESKTEEKAL